jgi:hypothetical protein
VGGKLELGRLAGTVGLATVYFRKVSRMRASNYYAKLQNWCGKCTFADTLHGAHLRAIFHGMQGKVDLRERLLLLDCADSIVQVLRLISILGVVLHVVQIVDSCGSCGAANGGGGGKRERLRARDGEGRGGGGR